MTTRKARVSIVDDQLEMARLLADHLEDEGYAAEAVGDGAELLRRAERASPDLVITDLRMAPLDGFDVLAGIQALDNTIPVLIMTAFGAVDQAVEAMRRGASHYFTKPFQLAEVVVYIERALAERRMVEENRRLRRLAGERGSLHDMLGQSPAMQALFDMVERVARTAAPVLVRGESGSGKELVARAVHALGPRQNRPFVAVNCKALPGSLLESELFGHVKGAYTGASVARRGLFVEADGGTLFLDEIGDMPLELQASLLRVLEDGAVRPVGADVSRAVDVRIVAATHQPLEQRIAEGRFREDLFFRLNVVGLRVPPLRERIEDIPVLVTHFVEQARSRDPGSRVERFAPELVAALARRPWPGNVRELANAVRRLVILGTPPEATSKDLAVLDPPPVQGGPLGLVAGGPVLPLREVEDRYIAWVIDQCGGNKTRAAELLGLDPSTIHRRIRRGD